MTNEEKAILRQLAASELANELEKTRFRNRQLLKALKYLMQNYSILTFDSLAHRLGLNGKEIKNIYLLIACEENKC